MKLLITGGGGFLGGWLARRMLARGWSVRVLDCNADRSAVEPIVGAATPEIEWLVGDVASRGDVAKATEGCDGVAHLAALLTPACRADPIRGVNVNLIGTINVFEAAKGHNIRRITYASSAGVFGPDDGAIPFPMTLYGAFKLACEGCARAYWADDGVASVGFRPLVVYGPGREVGGTAGVTVACRKAVQGEPYTIPFSGSTDLIFVDDVAAAFEAAVTRQVTGAHVFNLRGEVASVERIIEAIRTLQPNASLTAAGDPLPITPHITAHDTAGVLGALPHTILAEGIARTVEHYRQLL